MVRRKSSNTDGSRLGARAVVPAVLLAAVLTGVVAGGQDPQKPSQGAKAAPPQTVSRPSLDRLVARVNAYWGLLANSRNSAALAYVEPASRGRFESRQTPVFNNPRITALALSKNPAEVGVTVEVTRMMPPMPPLQWPVTESWVFRNGDWFVIIPEASSLPGLSGGRAAQPPPSPAETEKRRQALGDLVRFKSTTIEFGKVRRGETALASLGYQLSGGEPLDAVVTDAPDDLNLFLENRKLLPGTDRTIPINLDTNGYGGEVNEHFLLTLRRQDVAVSYEFKVHGFVYAPVTSSPGQLRFKPGETEQEIELTNRSREQVTLRQHQDSPFTVSTLPQTLLPGGTCRLKVGAGMQNPPRNYSLSLALDLDRQVEDMRVLRIPVTLNYVPPGTGPLTPEDILKLFQVPPVKK